MYFTLKELLVVENDFYEYLKTFDSLQLDNIMPSLSEQDVIHDILQNYLTHLHDLMGTCRGLKPSIDIVFETTNVKLAIIWNTV